MPWKSTAQSRAVNAKCKKGEIPQRVCDEFNAATKAKPGGFKSLPRHMPQKRGKRT